MIVITIWYRNKVLIIYNYYIEVNYTCGPCSGYSRTYIKRKSYLYNALEWKITF